MVLAWETKVCLLENNYRILTSECLNQHKGCHNINKKVVIPSKTTYMMLEFNYRLKEYYWPRVCKDVVNFTMSCVKCQRAKKGTHSHAVPLNPLPVVKVFERLHVDILGPGQKQPRS